MESSVILDTLARVSVIANALFINYAGLYILVLLLVPVGYLMIVFEERELVERFGEEYRKYQRRVPQLIPRLRKPIENTA
jgi:protein-S-isoprenylcysteine O-methyltransferase Ste14